MAYRRNHGRRHRASCGSSTPTARGCARTTAAPCRRSSGRRWPASRSRSPATAARPARSATSTTWSRASLRMLRSDLAGPVNIGNPHEMSMLELAALVRDSPGRQSEIVHVAAAGGRPDGPAAGHHAGPHRARLGAAGRARRRPAAHHRLVPAARGPVRRRLDRMSAASGPGHGRRAEVVVIGAGPAGPHRGARARSATTSPPRSSRPTTSSAASAGRSSATAGASTSAATASSPRCRAVEELWHEILPDDDFLMPAADEPDLLPRQVLRLPAAARSNALRNLGVGRGGPLRRRRTSGPGSARRRTRPRSRAGSSPASAGGSTGTSSRPTTRRSGACPATEIPADWAAQRIKNLSLCDGGRATRCMPKRRRRRDDHVSLIEEFHYPKFGPGMMWERCRELVAAAGGKVACDRRGHRDPPRGRAGASRS